MSRTKKGAAYDGKGQAPQEESAGTVDFTAELFSMVKNLMQKSSRVSDPIQALEQRRPAGTEGVQEEVTCWRRHDISRNGITLHTLASGTYRLHPRLGEQKRHTGYHKVERDLVSAFRPGPSHQKKDQPPR